MSGKNLRRAARLQRWYQARRSRSMRRSRYLAVVRGGSVKRWRHAEPDRSLSSCHRTALRGRCVFASVFSCHLDTLPLHTEGVQASNVGWSEATPHIQVAAKPHPCCRKAEAEASRRSGLIHATADVGPGDCSGTPTQLRPGSGSSTVMRSSGRRPRPRRSRGRQRTIQGQ